MGDSDVYAFDVDDTLEVSGGPIPISACRELANQGHIVGLCGNFAAVTQRVPGWQDIFSFIGPMGMTKADFLSQIKTYVSARCYFMVGNVPGRGGASDDVGAARAAGWEFIEERGFRSGRVINE
ncbi:MAG: hypothetical protein IH878_21555 [Gemmatimonadetes bacterium]|nr:hypothetical protein [Gemmatimonadota bacterium]